ncbi:MAG: hypothetical protein ACKOYM_08075 [Actinomycetes bacterium]
MAEVSRVLERTVGVLANRLDRRGFMTKAAVVGSAVVAAPLEFGLRPTSAYAAVCNCNGSACACGSRCCEGWTEFCCTTSGVNACPPGTLTAGWWKVDGSQFCGGAARYYLDCNAQCGSCTCGSNGVCSGACSGTRCGCSKGDCNNWKNGCNRFRYGQCNQSVRCVGPIVCRVVTCAPPWKFDPACGTSARTDYATAGHHRVCSVEPFGAVDRVADAGSAVRVKGWSVSNRDYSSTDIEVFVDEKLVRTVTASMYRPDVARAYPAAGAYHGYDTTIRVAPGKRLVCVWARDRRNGQRSLIGFREVVVAPPRIVVDRVTDDGAQRIAIVGWAEDPTRSGRRALVRIRIDDVEVDRFLTDVSRPDVVRVYPLASSTSGFSRAYDVAAGTHTICADLINVYGEVVAGPCRTIIVAPAPTTTTTTVPDTTTTVAPDTTTAPPV